MTNLILLFIGGGRPCPQFTASVILAYTRAVYRLAQGNETGARIVFDIAPSLLSKKSNE